MSYNNNFSYFNAPTSNNEWWGSKEPKKPTVFEDRGLVKIDYNNQPYAQNYMQNYAQSMILPSENRAVDPIHPRHEVLQGTVTQLFSAFGYVNDNIIFSKSDVSGPMVKVGDRVAVDATYQPNNPTKYKGERVCKIDDSRFSSAATNNLSKMKPLSKDISTRIDIPLTTYRTEVTKFEPPKKPEPKPPIKKFDKPIEMSPIRPPVVVAKEVVKPTPEPKRSVKAISPIDLTRSERSRSNSSRKNSRKVSPPLPLSMKRRLKRSAKRRSPSETKSTKSSKPSDTAKSDKQEKSSTLSSAVTTVTPKVVVDKLPKQQESFSLRELDCASLKFRCKNLQPPSQFFHVSLKYQSSFPLNHPMKLGNACHFKVMDRKVTSVDPLVNSLLHRDVDPDDADTTFSAKVMLLSTDDLASFYKNTLVLAEEFDSTNKIQITKAIKFLVGSLGQNKEFAFGGAWSPSLDGHDPDNNPQVLINTAIRTCKSLTGIDLSGCSSWPKFLELHYYRPLQKIRKRTPPSADRTTNATSPSNCSSASPGTPSELSTSTSNIAVIINSTPTTTVNGTSSKVSATNVEKTSGTTEPMDVPEERFEYIEPRMETVVYYVPDIWNCVTSQEGWNELKKAYQEQLTSLMCPPPSFPVPHAHNKQDAPGQSKKINQQSGPQTGTNAYSNSLVDNSNIAHQQHQEEEDYSYFNENEETEDKTGKDGTQSIASVSAGDQPSHFSTLNVDSMKIVEIKKELDLRKLSVRGVMDQLKGRLKNALEKEEADEKLKEGSQVAPKSATSDTKAVTDTVLSEAEKTELKQFYMLPDTPHIVVHHNVRCYSSKMRIKTMSLHSLLSYYDMKLEETAFEVALFAKQFLEMLRRDSVFNVYKSLVVTPEADFVVNAIEVPPAKKPKLLVTTSKRTVNRPLLFSCVILDREKTGKISLDDLKGMIEGLGICLSSDQLTNLLSKIQDPTRALNYRLLTDKEIDDCELSKMLTLDQTDDLDYIRELAMGNKALFEDRDMPVDMHPGDFDEIDRLKNELDKSERCRQNLELRFSELREEAEKNKALIVTQAKEITRHKDQSADYRSRYHREQDRGDHYKKDLEKLQRDLKTIDKMSGVLGKAVTECLDRCKKSTETPKLPSDSKSKAEEAGAKSKGGRASSTSSSSIGKGNGKTIRKSGNVLNTSATSKLSVASVNAGGAVSTGSAGPHSGIIAGNDEECASGVSGSGQDKVTSSAMSAGNGGGAGSGTQSKTITDTIDLDVELLGSTQHDIVLEADVDDVLLRPEDDELCLLPGDDELCLLPGDEDDLDMLQTVEDDNDIEDGDVDEVHHDLQEKDQQKQLEKEGEMEQDQCEQRIPSPVVLEDDDDEQDEQDQPEQRDDDKCNDMAAAVEQDIVNDKNTDDVVMTDETSSHSQVTENTSAKSQEPQPDLEMDQDQDQEDFDFSKPLDYEIIILDETE